MLQPVPNTICVVIKDADGLAINQSLPLERESYAVIERYCRSRWSIPAHTSAEEEMIYQQANILRRTHDKMRENDPNSACGNDLNNFWVLFESATVWCNEQVSPREKWGLERGVGFSDKYLSETLAVFAANINASYNDLKINPTDLKRRIERAAAQADECSSAFQDLKKIYINLRHLGYFDRELIQ